jgi:hypothetical protein
MAGIAAAVEGRAQVSDHRIVAAGPLLWNDYGLVVEHCPATAYAALPSPKYPNWGSIRRSFSRSQHGPGNPVGPPGPVVNKSASKDQLQNFWYVLPASS